MVSEVEIEALAKTLRDNNLAVNYEEALEMAKRMLGEIEEKTDKADDKKEIIEEEDFYDITKDKRTIKEIVELSEKCQEQPSK